MKVKKVIFDFNHILYPTIYWATITIILIIIYLAMYNKIIMNPMFYTILIVSLLLLAKIIMKIVYVMRVSANNTVFFKEPHIMKKSIKLPDIHFPQSDADVRFYYQFNLFN